MAENLKLAYYINQAFKGYDGVERESEVSCSRTVSDREQSVQVDPHLDEGTVVGVLPGSSQTQTLHLQCRRQQQTSYISVTFVVRVLSLNIFPIP